MQQQCSLPASRSTASFLLPTSFVQKEAIAPKVMGTKDDIFGTEAVAGRK